MAKLCALQLARTAIGQQGTTVKHHGHHGQLWKHQIRKVNQTTCQALHEVSIGACHGIPTAYGSLQYH